MRIDSLVNVKLGILVIVASMALVFYFLAERHMRVARSLGARNVLVTVVGAAKTYARENGAPLPSDATAAFKVLRGGNARGIVYIDLDPKSFSSKGIPLDPWGTAYVWNFSRMDSPSGYSFGPNRLDDGGARDDVASW